MIVEELSGWLGELKAGTENCIPVVVERDESLRALDKVPK